MRKLKDVLTIWVIVYGLVTVLFYLLQETLTELPTYLRTLLLSGIMVFGMQYLVLPVLHQLKMYTSNKGRNGNT